MATPGRIGQSHKAVPRAWLYALLYSNRQDMWLSDGLTLLGNFSGLSCFPNESFAHLFPQNGRTLEGHGGRHSLPWCSSSRDCPIDKLPTRCGDASGLVYAFGLELTDPGFDFSILSRVHELVVGG